MSEHYSGSALKKGAIQYLTGKLATATLTFAILITMVRILSLSEYGAYLVFVSGVELCISLSGFGIPWIASRYLPEYKLHASGAALKSFITRLIYWQITALLVSALLAYLFLNVYLKAVGLNQYKWVAEFFIVVFVIEGVGRFYRDFIFGPLLLQKAARTSLVSRHLSLFLIVFVLGVLGHASLNAVVLAELTASTIGLVFACLGYNENIKEFQSYAGEPTWSEPPIKSQWRVGLNMYMSFVLTLSYSPHVFINIVQRFLGQEASALFGFLRNLNDQIARNLPANLLVNFIKPKLVANFVKGGGVDGLSRDANLAGKLSLFVLMPLIVFSALVGSQFISILSGAKFNNSGFLFFGFVSVILLPFSQRQTLESVAVILNKAKLCSIASFSGLIMLPLVYIMLNSGLGLWSAILAVGSGYFLFNIIVIAGLKKLNYKVDYQAVIKLVVSSVATYIISKFIIEYLVFSIEEIPQAIKLIMVFCIGSTLYLYLTWLIKPFSSNERGRLNKIINRKLFIW